MVTGVTYRNPALLAKTVTTLDVISSGRAILGIGAAWNDDEHAGYGFEFPPLRERFERLEEAVQICRAMFTQEAPSFEGRHYRIAGALNFPRPVRPGGPPILIGGSGERRTIPLLARLRRRVQLLRRRPHDPAQAGRARPRLRAGRPRSGRDHKDAPRRGRDRTDTGRGRAQGQMGGRVRHLDPERVRTTFIIGDPSSVAEQVDAFMEAGLDGMLISLPDAHDIETVELAAHTLAGRLGSATAFR